MTKAQLILTEVCSDTLEDSGEVLVGLSSSRVLELHMLVGPPGDADVGQRNLDLCAVGVVVKQLQCVCNKRKGLIRNISVMFSSTEQETGLPLNMLLAMAPHGAIGLLS